MAEAGKCAGCKHWQTAGRDWDEIVYPTDPDTMEPMAVQFAVRQCKHPELMFCERPLRPDGFAVADGSQYMATLYTAENFGCVLWETVDG